MVLNIVKNDLPASCIAEYVRCVFDNAKVNIKDEKVSDNVMWGRDRVLPAAEFKLRYSEAGD